jgi:uncharacterized protein
MIAVLDSNAVIGLAKGECLELLRGVFRKVLIPTVVRREVIEEGVGRPGSRELGAALGEWIEERTPTNKRINPSVPATSPEDQEVLRLAAECGAVLVTDDSALQSEAARLGILTIGTVEAVILLKQKEVIPAVKPVLDLMQARAHHIAPALYEQALLAAGEAP